MLTMFESLPPWTEISIEHPPHLAQADAGGVLVVLVTTPGVSREWAAASAVELAKVWRGAGRRVVLADGCLDAPCLHGALGVANSEGLADAVLFGASAGRVETLAQE